MTDNVPRERDALAAFHLAAEPAIRGVGAFRPLTRRVADLLFLQGIANANDHVSPHLMRIILYNICECLAIEKLRASKGL